MLKEAAATAGTLKKKKRKDKEGAAPSTADGGAADGAPPATAEGLQPNSVGASADGGRWEADGAAGASAAAAAAEAEAPPTLPPSEVRARTMAVLRGHSGPVYGVGFSRDDNYVISGSQDGTARLWGVLQRTCLVCYHAHDSPVWAGKRRGGPA